MDKEVKDKSPKKDSDGDYDETDAEAKDKGVHVPESFQKKVYALLEQCDSEECCDYVRSCLSRHEQERRDKENEGKPKEFSVAGMPR